jgi:hypothetical protein
MRIIEIESSHSFDVAVLKAGFYDLGKLIVAGLDQTNAEPIRLFAHARASNPRKSYAQPKFNATTILIKSIGLAEYWDR